MWPHESQRWCEVSHRMGAPQLSHGARPPMVGWQEAGGRVEVCASLTGHTVATWRPPAGGSTPWALAGEIHVVGSRGEAHHLHR